jgi:hypothetical protein
LHNSTACLWYVPEPPAGSVVSGEDYDRARAEALIDECAAIENRQHSVHQLNLWNATLYSNRLLTGFTWGAHETADHDLTPCNLITENLVLSIGDAMLSRAASSPTRVKPTPRGASWNTYTLVKKLDRWLSGVWRDLQIEELLLQVFLDAYIAGTGTLRIGYDPHKKKLCAERVFFDNVIIDNSECSNTDKPRTERVRQVVPAESVEERYGIKFTDEERSKQYSDRRVMGKGWVPVVEAWRLPGADGSPGRHTVACCGHLLLDEPWTRETSDLVHFHWARRTTGWYRGGGVEQVVPYQVRLNEVNEVIRDAQDLMARPRILVHSGSNIDINAITNEVGRIVRYSGIEPKALTWDAVSGELYNERDRQVRSCFEFFGMSQMTAQAQLPSGVRLDSSAAVREFRVQEDQRFLDLWRRFEQARIDCAATAIDVMTNVRGDHETTWRAGGRWIVDRIKWSDVKEITKDDITWSLEAVSLVDQAPGARLDTLNTWVAQGYIDPIRAGVMSGIPDLEAAQDLETAESDDIKRVLNDLEEGEYDPPDPTQNLNLGITSCKVNLARIRGYDDVPEKVTRVHLQWMRQALALVQSAVEQPAPPPAPPMGPETAPLVAPGSAMTPIIPMAGPDAMPMSPPPLPGPAI